MTIIPIYLFMNIVLSGIWLLQGKYKNAVVLYKAIFWNVGKLKSTLQKRSRIQKIRKVSDKEYFKLCRKNPRVSYYIALLTRKFENYVDSPL